MLLITCATRRSVHDLGVFRQCLSVKKYNYIDRYKPLLYNIYNKNINSQKSLSLSLVFHSPPPPPPSSTPRMGGGGGGLNVVGGGGWIFQITQNRTKPP